MLTLQSENEWLKHFSELRQRMLLCFIFFMLIFCCLFYFSSVIYHFFANPLLKYLPSGSKIIATNIISPFSTPLRLNIYLTFFIVLPLFLYNIFAFIIPGLYQQEKKLLWPLLTASIFLFYLGIAFTYYVVLPLTFRFITYVVPQDIIIMPDMSHYLDFVLQMMLIFSLAFETPIVVFLMLVTGILTLQKLVSFRPYIIVLAFILGMLFTPPDVVSQILLAIPLWFLYECGIFFARIYLTRRC